MGFKNKNIEKFSDNQSSQCGELLNPPGGAIGFFIFGAVIFIVSIAMYFDSGSPIVYKNNLVLGIMIVISVVLLSIGGWKYTEYEKCKENNTTSSTPA